MTVQVDGLNAVDIEDNPLMLAQCVVCYHEARCNAMAVTVGWVFEAPKDEQPLQLDVEMMFSGFRFLESRPEVMEGLAKYAGIPGHKWGIQASGVLILGPAACKKVFGEPWPNVPVFTQEQSTRISMFISKAIKVELKSDREAVAIQLLGNGGMEERCIHFLAIAPCSKEDWTDLYNHKSMEMGAAMEYWKQIEGELAVDASKDQEIVSPNRDLH